MCVSNQCVRFTAPGESVSGINVMRIIINIDIIFRNFVFDYFTTKHLFIFTVSVSIVLYEIVKSDVLVVEIIITTINRVNCKPRHFTVLFFCPVCYAIIFQSEIQNTPHLLTRLVHTVVVETHDFVPRIHR